MAPVAITRAILSGSANGEVSSRPVIPADAINSASTTVATQTPMAPAAIWRFAISGHLCAFEWGRNDLPEAFT